MSYYRETRPTYTVSVLGTDYAVYTDVPTSEDEQLETLGGYCDKTTHRVVVGGEDEEANLGDFSQYAKQCLRHELIHAFLFESGLGVDSVWHVAGQEHPEQLVDWLARQFPKILKAFQEVNAL